MLQLTIDGILADRKRLADRKIEIVHAHQSRGFEFHLDAAQHTDTGFAGTAIRLRQTDIQRKWNIGSVFPFVAVGVSANLALHATVSYKRSVTIEALGSCLQ